MGWRGLRFGASAVASTRASSDLRGLTLGGMDAGVFSAAKVEELRKLGKSVFVDFTAAWCVTCQVNERLVFTSEEIRKRFAQLGVQVLQADWTNRDENITRTLDRYGRSGVPLYLLYPADPSKPALVLPEIITPGIVLDALNQL